MFFYRVAKYIGAYTAVLGGLDALTFTGIGEHSPTIRARVCQRLAFLGIELAEDLNRTSGRSDRRISRGVVEVWVVPANEELEMARLTYDELLK